MKQILLSFLLLFLFSFTGTAQTRVTFRVDMRSQIKDSTFIPEIGSVRIKGDQIPFSGIHTITLRDVPPTDSIYVAEVRFPSIVNDKLLKYKFIIRMPYETIKEYRFRLLPLEGQEETLNVALFNGFVH